jgi:hypothetical protein
VLDATPNRINEYAVSMSYALVKCSEQTILFNMLQTRSTNVSTRCIKTPHSFMGNNTRDSTTSKKIRNIPDGNDCWFTENRAGVCMLKLWAAELEKIGGEFGVEKPLFPPNWEAGLLLPLGEFLSPNMPLFAPN